MLRIVIDSAGDLPANWLNQYDIHVIPINIHFGNRMFLQGVDLSNADFYRLADETGVIPQTSQPSPQQFTDFYRKIAQPGDTILSMHVTSKLSGTFASCEVAAQELSNEYHITPFDSACGSAGMGYMAREARLMERLGASLDLILERLKQIRSKMQIVLTLNTLEYARRSGRVKALQAALASLLNVKPVISLRDGILELGDRIRTRRKALEFVLEEVVRRQGARLINAAVVHAQDPDVGDQLMEMVRKRLNINELIMTELSIGVAANLGPGTVGIVAYPVDQG
ncbi:MAG: DegV family protein [Anaerolineales bacterium]|nr:DegV family protein [Anaerolineales bacterium]